MVAPPAILTSGGGRTPLALANAAVLPMTGESLPGPHTVLVDQGAIAGIVASRVDAIPTGARVLDCTGKTLMPGLVDAHAHVSHPASAALWLCHGVTAVRDMWGSPVQLTWRDDVAAGRLAGPRLVPASPYLDGIARYPGVVAVDSPEAAAAAAAEYVRVGYAALKVYSGLSLPALRAAGEVARDAGIPVVGHCPDGVSIADALTAGQRGFEHLLGLLAGFPSADPALDIVERVTRLHETPWDHVRRAGTSLAEAGATVTPTLAVMSRLADRAADHADDPALAHVPAAARRRWARAGIPVPPGRSARELRDAIAGQLRWYRRAAAIFVEEGATLLVGTDAGSIWTVPGFAMADEMRELQRSGFTAEQILKAATVDSAAACGQSGWWGRLAVGQSADLLVLDEDPLLDPTAATRPAAVLMGGVYLAKADLDSALADHADTVEAIAALPERELAPMARPAWFDR